MLKLNTAVRLADHDRIYQALIDMHEGLSDAESQRINARLILLLANQVGDDEAVLEAMRTLRIGTGHPPGTVSP